MYVETRPHYSKTRGLSSVLNLRTSSTQVRRPTSHEPTSPEHGRKRDRHRASGVYQQYTVGAPLLPRNLRFSHRPGGSLAAQRASPTQCIEFKTIRLSNYPKTLSSPGFYGGYTPFSDSYLVPTIHPLFPGLGSMSANPINLDARRSCPNLEARSGRPRRWSTDPARHSYYQWARQRRLARRLLGRYVSAPELAPPAKSFCVIQARLM